MIRRTARDARGRRVRVLSGASLSRLTVATSLSRHEAELVGAKLRGVPTWGEAFTEIAVELAVYIVLLIGPIVGLVIWHGWAAGYLPAVVREISYTVPLAAVGAAAWGLTQIPSPPTKRCIAALLSVRRCPACGYNLKGCTTERDGCTVCPECGAAWRCPPNPQGALPPPNPSPALPEN